MTRRIQLVDGRLQEKRSLRRQLGCRNGETMISHSSGGMKILAKAKETNIVHDQSIFGGLFFCFYAIQDVGKPRAGSRKLILPSGHTSRPENRTCRPGGETCLRSWERMNNRLIEEKDQEALDKIGKSRRKNWGGSWARLGADYMVGPSPGLTVLSA
jgi:hypothetical protein